MKNASILVVFSILFSIMGCTNRVSNFTHLTERVFPPTSVDSLKLYFAPEKPDRAFETIGYVNVIVHTIGEKDTIALMKMKEKAAQNGADAILNITISDAGINVNTGGRDASFVGLAVKWK